MLSLFSFFRPRSAKEATSGASSGPNLRLENGHRGRGMVTEETDFLLQRRPWLFQFLNCLSPSLTFLHQHARPDHQRAHAAGLPREPAGSGLEEPRGVAVAPQVQSSMGRSSCPVVPGFESLFAAGERRRREVLELVIVVLVVILVLDVDGEAQGPGRGGGKRRERHAWFLAFFSFFLSPRPFFFEGRNEKKN